MKKLILSSFFALSALVAFTQATVRGQLKDAQTDQSLIGANVLHNQSNTGTISDTEGNFTLQLPTNTGKIEISYLGYSTRVITLDGSSNTYDMGEITLNPSAVGLEEVVVTGVMDIVKDRRTPVAVSTIGTMDIQSKGGNVEFPELMKSTPSIYVAGQAGGYGDSEVFTRGFDQTNTAFLLNGQPINGMEDGRMYWSNWSGMTDVATAVQIQRGLGSSKLAISSVGGTTNIIMKSTEQLSGGSVSFLRGNDNYNKITASYNTGLMNDKFGVTVLLTHWQGDGWAEGTKGQGQNYFISAGLIASPSHNFNFLLTGAPQWHDQNFSKNINSHYNSGEFNIKFNNNFGYLDDEYLSYRRNYYHKPVANLNWEWTLSNKSSLSTVLYASWGRGGGSGDIGNRNNRFFTSDGYVDWDAVHSANVADAGAEEWVIRNSVNNHSWYGLVTNYQTTLSSTFSLSLGADLRTYNGSHFQELRDLVGAPSYSQRANARFGDREVTALFKANPWSSISSFAELSERIGYNNDETISYAGVFGQLEYSTNNWSGYVQGALSNQSHVRIELFNEPENTEESEKVNNMGYNLKTGASYLLDGNNSVFVNTGYYQRQPFHDDIYLNFSNFVNPVTEPEKIFGLEAGYKYVSKDLAINFNVYRTSWKDRTTTLTLSEGDMLPNGTVIQEEGFRNSIQDQLHTGIELDFSYDLNDKVRIKGFTSIGDWAYEGNINSDYYNESRELIFSQEDVDVNGIKVGGAAQTTFGIGSDLKLTKEFRIDLDYLYYDKLHSNISASNSSLELPSFGLLDVGATYNFVMTNGQLLTLRANVYNALGKEYISRATSAIPASSNESENWNGVNRGNFVTFGQTTTWNVSAKYSF